MGKVLKFMGSADVRTVPKGTDFGGQLKKEDAVQKDVVFNSSNHWMVDTDEAGLSTEQVDLLVESGDFKDVTDMKRVPVNDNQAMFHSMKSVPDVEVDLVSEASSTTSDTGTTTGGSTTAARRKGTSDPGVST